MLVPWFLNGRASGSRCVSSASDSHRGMGEKLSWTLNEEFMGVLGICLY
jgi:hypothetical protein